MKSFLKLFATVAISGLTLHAYAADYAVILKTLSNPFWVSMQDVCKNGVLPSENHNLLKQSKIKNWKKKKNK